MQSYFQHEEPTVYDSKQSGRADVVSERAVVILQLKSLHRRIHSFSFSTEKWLQYRWREKMVLYRHLVFTVWAALCLSWPRDRTKFLFIIHSSEALCILFINASFLKTGPSHTSAPNQINTCLTQVIYNNTSKRNVSSLGFGCGMVLLVC